NTDSIWESLFAINPDLGNRSIHSLDISNWALVMEAIACVDNALWDALGKIYGLPVYKLLGGFRDQVPVIGIAGYQGMDLAALNAEVTHYQSLQLAGINIPVGELTVREDLQRVAAIRKATGDDFIVVVNADERWTLEQAFEFCQGAKDFRLAWIEEPAHWSD